MDKRIWFEARFLDRGFSSKRFATELEARSEIEDMREGYPDNTFMTDENRVYWKNAAERMVVVKITETEEVLQ